MKKDWKFGQTEDQTSVREPEKEGAGEGCEFKKEKRAKGMGEKSQFERDLHPGSAT